MNLKEAEQNIGKKVIMRKMMGFTDDVREYGIITAVNNKYVMVRLGRDKAPSGIDAKDLILFVEE